MVLPREPSIRERFQLIDWYLGQDAGPGASKALVDKAEVAVWKATINVWEGCPILLRYKYPGYYSKAMSVTWQSEPRRDILDIFTWIQGKLTLVHSTRIDDGVVHC